ncbi:MAG: GNAT family N-acetyltransferase [Alphaproteobacteria bacterium]|nr:GNAT family N-acetyltransferase [Alphaproteobacteria bacterium]
MEALTIRPAIPSDASEIVRLIRALAGASDRPRPWIAPVTEASVLADGFGPSPAFEAILGERGRSAVGLAQFYPSYAAWIGVRTMVIANLYVSPDERKTGLGRQLVQAAARRAMETGAKRIELFVEIDNPARAFYGRLGFAEMTDIRCRMEADAIRKLAEAS